MKIINRAQPVGCGKKICFTVGLALSVWAVPGWAKGPYTGPISYWTCASGDWSNSHCWSSPPVVGDNILLTQSGILPYTVTYDSSQNILLRSLVINGVNGVFGGTMNFIQPQGNLRANSEYVGDMGYMGYVKPFNGDNPPPNTNSTLGAGTFTQTGGTNTTGYLTLGYGFAGQGNVGYGTYTLSGGSLTAGTEYIGFYTTGNFTQTGGKNVVNNLLLSYSNGSNGTYTLSGGTLIVSQSVSIGNGTGGTGTFNLNKGTLLNVNTLNNSFTGTLNNSGTLDIYTGGTLTNAGVLQNHTGGTLNNHGTLNNSGTMSNQGTLSNSGMLSNKLGAIIVNSGKLDNSGMLNNESVIINNGNFINAGSFINTGSVVGAGDFTQAAGSSQIDGIFVQSQINIQSGSLFGNGQITSPVVKTDGIVQGGASGTPGKLSINGKFIMGSGGTLQELINSSISFSSLNVSGSAQLGGILDIVPSMSFSFAAGQTFTIADFTPGGLTGQFAHVDIGGFIGNGSGVNIGGGLYIKALYNNSLGDVQLQVEAVPEPAESLMMLMGLGLMGFLGLRKKKATHAS